LRGHDFEHPVWLSPDWPPHSELALAIYQIQCRLGDRKACNKAIIALMRRWKVKD
jgi:hypothetical protein